MFHQILSENVLAKVYINDTNRHVTTVTAFATCQLQLTAFVHSCYKDVIRCIKSVYFSKICNT